MSGLEFVQAMVDGILLHPSHPSLADTIPMRAVEASLHTLLDRGTGYGTVDLHVKMLKAVPP